MAVIEKWGIPGPMLETIFEQAEKEYPRECCGMILSLKDQMEAYTRVRACRNAQDDYHRLDPENFPRTSTTAYFIDPKELLRVQKELREKNEMIRIIYHSHIDRGAYFSEEDQRVAISEGEPAYPGVKYFVMSVMQGKVKDGGLFVWNAGQKKFQS